ncbi:MAG TPA: hypothetical protein VKV17_09150 [Bryobacteraceae bacterium]|nr:hypothetical protein [Bryobacteraceae bacterium]
MFFPSQWLGGTDFDRSPGTASTIGLTNFGGSINLLSRQLSPDPGLRATYSYGSWNTRLLGLDHDSGDVGKSNFTVDFHQLLSDCGPTLRTPFPRAFHHAIGAAILGV